MRRCFLTATLLFLVNLPSSFQYNNVISNDKFVMTVEPPLGTSKQRWCPYDEGHLRIQLSSEFSTAFWIGLYLNASSVPSIRISPNWDQDYLKEMTTSTTVLKCAPQEDEDPLLLNLTSSTDVMCQPEIKTVTFTTHRTDGEEDEITLKKNNFFKVEFSEPTTEPPVESMAELSKIFDFKIKPGNVTGSWINSQTLNVTVLDGGSAKYIKRFFNGMKLKRETITHRPTTTNKVVQHKLSIRIGQAGLYRVEALRNNDSESFFSSLAFEIQNCFSDAVIHSVRMPPPSSSKTTKRESIPAASPDFHIPGMIALDSLEPLELPDKVIPDSTSSWSLSFWIYLDQDSTGVFRTLFYKGPGHGHRTPSAWFLPESRKLAMRVSTVHEMDHGVESSSEIPLREWAMATFVFTNCSSGISVNSNDVRRTKECQLGVHYRQDFYLNGHLDRTMNVHNPVIANSGPLYVGKDDWMEGIVGQVKDFRIYGRALAANEILTQYSKLASSNKDVQTINPETPMLLMLGQPSNMTNFSSENALSEIEQQDFYEQAKALQRDCGDVEEVLDLLLSSGTTEGFYEAGLIYLYGAESCTATREESKVVVEADESSKTTKKENYIVSFRDTVLARKYLTEAAAKGHADATHLLAVMVASGIGVTRHAFMESPTQASVAVTTEGEKAVSIARHDFVENSKNLSLNLYHKAASAGSRKAAVILANRYNEGNGVVQSTDTAAHYYFVAAKEAAKLYGFQGKAPLLEMNKLSEATEDTIDQGQRGDDDEILNFHKMEADKGDVSAMLTMGDLYYWGGRGLERNFERAFHYFQSASNAGNTEAVVALAGMYLKGEGTAQDNSTALELYQKGAAEGNVRSLNGLGFLYYHGEVVEKNLTKALEYFEGAAAQETEADSLFNCGYMHRNGQGTEKNLTKALEYFTTAATKFGSFDASFQAGQMHFFGHGTERSVSNALVFLKPAAMAGGWGETVRKGFEQYLDGDHVGAAIYYHEASELGYEIAGSNIAYLYRKNLIDTRQLVGAKITGDEFENQERAFEFLSSSADAGDVDSYVPLGDYYYYGYLGEVDVTKAMYWYVKASASGVAQGAYNIGFMYEYGVYVDQNLVRASRYYNRVLELSPTPEARVAVALTLWRVSLKRTAKKYDFSIPFLQSGVVPPAVTNSSDMNETTTNPTLVAVSTLSWKDLVPEWVIENWLLLTTEMAFTIVVAVRVARRHLN